MLAVGSLRVGVGELRRCGAVTASGAGFVDGCSDGLFAGRVIWRGRSGCCPAGEAVRRFGEGAGRQET